MGKKDGNNQGSSSDQGQQEQSASTPAPESFSTVSLESFLASSPEEQKNSYLAAVKMIEVQQEQLVSGSKGAKENLEQLQAKLDEANEQLAKKPGSGDPALEVHLFAMWLASRKSQLVNVGVRFGDHAHNVMAGLCESWNKTRKQPVTELEKVKTAFAKATIPSLD